PPTTAFVTKSRRCFIPQASFNSRVANNSATGLWRLPRRVIRWLSRPMGVILCAAVLLLSLKAWGMDQRARLETPTGTLHGTLDLPNGTAPCPAVVIIAGSGPTDRDGNQAAMKNDSLKMLGQALAAKGVAALRYDKRGVAESAAAASREE